MMMRALASLVLAIASSWAGETDVIFKDDFRGGLAGGWTWLREDPASWRANERGLEIRVLPGNMWGRSNNATNILVRPVPDPTIRPIAVSVTVSNQPSGQYEQADLVWFYDESHMVKIGQERVDGVLCLVMGREKADKTKTLAKIPITALSLELKLVAHGDTVKGQYRPAGENGWRDAAGCTLPKKGEPKVSLQVYQGPRDAMHWARFSAFQITRGK